MKNWEALGEPDKAAAAKKWVVEAYLTPPRAGHVGAGAP